MLYFVQQFSLDEEGEAKMLHKVQQFHLPQGKIARKYCIKYNNLRALGNIIPEMLYEIQHFFRWAPQQAGEQPPQDVYCLRNARGEQPFLSANRLEKYGVLLKPM